MPAPREIDPPSVSAEDQRFENALLAAYNFFQTRSVVDSATVEKNLGNQPMSKRAGDPAGG